MISVPAPMSPAPSTRPWICAQIGAREHYAIPRVLARGQRLERLLTDYWWPPGSLRPPGGAGRWHPQLATARVFSLNWRALARDALGRRQEHWERIQARNAWFARAHLERLRRQRRYLRSLPAGVFFAYSYAARDLLAFFRDLGWKTLLGQIDPGPGEAERVAREAAANPDWAGSWRPPPDSYWDNLRAEQALADRVLVNSEWSRRLCREAGIPVDKLRILPLAYEPPVPAPEPRRYPRHFDASRPLRVLFLGQLNLRKGIHYLLESARELAGEPVEFWLAGPREFAISREFQAHPGIRWLGPIPRERTGDCYARADVFVLPTLSDGFAITQLEAQAHGLPVIASRHCAAVVDDGVNGLILDPPDSRGISACLRRCLHEPGLLDRLAAASGVAHRFSLDALAAGLEALERD